MRSGFSRLLLATVVLSACDSATVPERNAVEVYDFRLAETDPPSVLRWPTGSTVRVYVHGGDDVARAGQLRDALKHAVRAWNEAVRFGEYRLTVSTTLDAADAVVMWSTDLPPVETADCTPLVGGRATTTFCLDDSGDRLRPFPIPGMTNSPVRFLVTIRTAEAGDPARVRAFVTHEIGHVLGISQHSPSSTDLMYTGDLLRDVPNVRDRATVQLLYQATPDIVP